MRAGIVIFGSGLVALLSLGGCGGHGSGAAAGPAVSAADQAEADQIFSTRCTTCHGPSGRGDGPASAGLTPRPRNFADQAWQTSVTDEHLVQIIQYGGSAVHLSPAMPPNPDLQAKPGVVNGLVHKVRTLGQ